MLQEQTMNYNYLSKAYSQITAKLYVYIYNYNIGRYILDINAGDLTNDVWLGLANLNFAHLEIR